MLSSEYNIETILVGNYSYLHKAYTKSSQPNSGTDVGGAL